MGTKYHLPDALLSIVLVYEGSVVKAYLIAILRRLSVRSYQRILSRHFHFYGLDRFCFHHLIRLLQTELFSIQRFQGVVTQRVYRKSIIPWLPLIHRLKMRNTLHNMVMHMLYVYPKGHPMYRVQTEWGQTWLCLQKTIIMGTRSNNSTTMQSYF